MRDTTSRLYPPMICVVGCSQLPIASKPIPLFFPFSLPSPTRDFGHPARRSARSLSTLVGPAPVSASAPTTHQPCEEFLHCNLAAGHGLARGLQQHALFFRSGIIPFLRCLQRKGRGRRVHTYISTFDLGMLAWRVPDWTGELCSDTCATSANPGS
jgi:hypothetical protein